MRVAALTGKLGRTYKSFITGKFPDNESEYHVLVSTLSGDCGINITYFSWVVHNGLPVSLTGIIRKSSVIQP